MGQDTNNSVKSLIFRNIRNSSIIKKKAENSIEKANTSLIQMEIYERYSRLLVIREISHTHTQTHGENVRDNTKC